MEDAYLLSEVSNITETLKSPAVIQPYIVYVAAMNFSNKRSLLLLLSSSLLLLLLLLSLKSKKRRKSGSTNRGCWTLKWDLSLL